MATESVSSIRSSGGDYTTLTAWESGEQADLVTADEIAVAECYDDWASGLSDDVGIAGWTTDSTRYVEIRPASGAGHGGTIGDGFYLTSSSPSSGFGVIRAGVDLHLTDLEVRYTGSTTTDNVLEGLSGGDITANRCIFSGGSSATGTEYLVDLKSSTTCVFNNCLFFGYKRAIDCRPVSSCTFSNCVMWLHADEIVLIADAETATYNTYAGKASGSAQDFWTGGSAPSGSHNASSDTSAQTDYTSSLNSKAGADNFVSVTAGSEDFHLDGTGVDLYNVGTSRSGQYTTDIDGDTWTNWSIGVDQPAAGVDYQETISSSVTSSANLVETYQAAGFSEVLSSSVTSSANLIETYQAPSYSEVLASSVTSSATLAETYGAPSYSEVLASSVSSSANLVETYGAPNYSEVLASAVTSSASLVEAYEFGQNYQETLTASVTSSATFAEAYQAPAYNETIAVSVTSSANLVETWEVAYTEVIASAVTSSATLAEIYESGLNFAETISASVTSSANLVETYGAPSYSEVLASAVTSSATFTEAFTTPQALPTIVELSAITLPGYSAKSLRID